jgi:2-isopropylmalate synthase
MTYEIMTPQSIGRRQSTLVLGRHSGKHGLKERLKELGYVVSTKDLDKVFMKFTEIADKKKEVFNEDLIALIEEELNILPETFTLEYFSVITGNNVIPTATVRLRSGKQVIQEAATGDGPVDAVYRAIEKITDTPVKLSSYSINAVTRGKDAMGGVTITVEKDNRIFRGYGVATDVIEASVYALINAINRIYYNGHTI